MSDKCILGGKIANAIYIHQETLHLTLEPEMMLILFLMQSHKKFSVIEDPRALLWPLSNCALSSFSWRTMRQTSISSHQIDTRDSLDSFHRLSEALMFSILKTKRLLGRFRVYMASTDISTSGRKIA